MVSVCLASYNGGAYIGEQIRSILRQLKDEDELIISDDGSTDDTIDVILSFDDKRIRLLKNENNHGVAGNFENALANSKGDYIFFSDQDDVWFPNKISEMVEFLKSSQYDVITCNCTMTDSHLNVIRPQYYEEKSPIDKSAFGNFIKDMWLGCCMAFKSTILREILPFPKRVAAHDLWIAIYSQVRFRCGYYPKSLQYYRRHDGTVSFADGHSSNSLRYKLSYRMYLALHLVKRLLFQLIRHR